MPFSPLADYSHAWLGWLPGCSPACSHSSEQDSLLQHLAPGQVCNPLVCPGAVLWTAPTLSTPFSPSAVGTGHKERVWFEIMAMHLDIQKTHWMSWLGCLNMGICAISEALEGLDVWLRGVAQWGQAGCFRMSQVPCTLHPWVDTCLWVAELGAEPCWHCPMDPVPHRAGGKQSWLQLQSLCPWSRGSGLLPWPWVSLGSCWWSCYVS